MRHTSKPGLEKKPESKKIRTREEPGSGQEKNPDSSLRITPDLTFENPPPK
jgi:hypothetical protein